MTRINADRNKGIIQTKIDMFYPAFPKFIPFRNYSFVEPDLRVKFPVLRCCNGRHLMNMNSNTDVVNNLSNVATTTAPIPASVTPPPEIEISLPISTTNINSGNNNRKYDNKKIGDDYDFFGLTSATKNTSNLISTTNINSGNNNKKYDNKKIGNDDDFFGLTSATESTSSHFEFTPHRPKTMVTLPISTSNINSSNNNRGYENNEVEVIDLGLPIKKELNTITETIAEQQAMDDFILDEPVNKEANLACLRQNLTLDVVAKSLGNFRKLIEKFKEIYPDGVGLIYCMSKNECETVADVAGTDAVPYHMDLPELIRQETQQRWMQNDVRILCATNAFGKSVNKPDVRFIIHYTLPQSLTLYEQQCELAGMDGQLAHCVLLYSFNDHLRVWRLIENDMHKPPPNVLLAKEQALRDVLRYGESIGDCRRKWLANYFGEKYTEQQCINTICPCTVCILMHERSHLPIPLFDFTNEALAVFNSVVAMRNVGIIYVADLFRGHLTKKRVKNQVDNSNDGRLPVFGLGQGLSDADCRRFIQKLVIDEYMRLRTMTTRHGTVIGYLYLAKKGWTMMNKYKQRPDSVPPDERIYMHVLEHHKNERRRSSNTINNRDSTGGAGGTKKARRSTHQNYIDMEDEIVEDEYAAGQLEVELDGDEEEWGDLYCYTN